MSHFLFTSVKSEIHPSFWLKCWELKLTEWKLSVSPISVSYEFAKDTFILDEHSFTNPPSGKKCVLINCNTLEDFKVMDKNKALETVMQGRWEAIGRGESDSLYECCLLLSYIDLKTHQVVYWFCAGTFVPETSSPNSNSTFTPVSAPKKLDHELEAALDSVDSRLKTDFSLPFGLQLDNNQIVRRTVKQVLDERVTRKFYIVLRDDNVMRDDLVLGWQFKNLFAFVCKYLHDCCLDELAPICRVSFIVWRIQEGSSRQFDLDLPRLLKYAPDNPKVSP